MIINQKFITNTLIVLLSLQSMVYFVIVVMMLVQILTHFIFITSCLCSIFVMIFEYPLNCNMDFGIKSHYTKSLKSTVVICSTNTNPPPPCSKLCTGIEIFLINNLYFYQSTFDKKKWTNTSNKTSTLERILYCNFIMNSVSVNWNCQIHSKIVWTNMPFVCRDVLSDFIFFPNEIIKNKSLCIMFCCVTATHCKQTACFVCNR